MGYPQFGTVSHGALRQEDLIYEFASELGHHDPGKAKEIRDRHSDVYELINSEDYSTEDASVLEQFDWLLNELEEALQELAPPYGYFGAHPGDGSDYGFWPDLEYIQAETKSGELATINEHGEVVINSAGGIPEYAVSVSDHGNVTLYKVEVSLEEVWSIV